MKFSIDGIKELLQNKDRIGSWVVKYKRQVAVGCILVCLAVVATAGFAGKKSGETPTAKTDMLGAVAATVAEEEVPTEETNDLEKDAYAEVNAVVQQYYDYMAAGDMEGLATVVDEISEEEKNRILNSRNLVEGYQNISCYTKKGLEEGSYLVFVYYELKFVRIETAAPGLQPLYVYTNEEGNLYVYKSAETEEMTAYKYQMAEEADVMALREEVREKYAQAKEADEELVRQEERYVRLASGKGEETFGETEGNTDETADETPEETAAEEPSSEETPQEEETAQTGEATAQNRETRFTESVRLRAEPSTEADSLGTAYPGEHVTQIESYSDGWSKISYKGKECYCKTEFLE